MSEETGETPRRTRALLPWGLALALFLVLGGLVAAMVIGLATDPVPERAESAPAAPVKSPVPEIPAAAAEPTPAEPQAVPAPAPEPAAPPETTSVPEAESEPPAASEAPSPSDVTPPPPLEVAAASKPPAPPAKRGDALPPAPDSSLVEESSFGLLPRIGLTGREPWQVYARPSKVSAVVNTQADR